MRNQTAIEQKLDRLNLALAAHQRQINLLGLQDNELLSILRAEQHMLLTEITALNWVLEESPDDTEPAHRKLLDRIHVGAGR
jgi:hypothetical protein